MDLHGHTIEKDLRIHPGQLSAPGRGPHGAEPTCTAAARKFLTRQGCIPMERPHPRVGESMRGRHRRKASRQGTPSCHGNSGPCLQPGGPQGGGSSKALTRNRSLLSHEELGSPRWSLNGPAHWPEASGNRLPPPSSLSSVFSPHPPFFRGFRGKCGGKVQASPAMNSP